MIDGNLQALNAYERDNDAHTMAYEAAEGKGRQEFIDLVDGARIGRLLLLAILGDEDQFEEECGRISKITPTFNTLMDGYTVHNIPKSVSDIMWDYAKIYAEAQA